MRFKAVRRGGAGKAAVSNSQRSGNVSKPFILTGCGLRRSEADKLEWSAIDFERAILHRADQVPAPKSEKSIGDIDLGYRDGRSASKILCQAPEHFRTGKHNRTAPRGRLLPLSGGQNL